MAGPTSPVLIRNADVFGTGLRDVLIQQDRIVRLGRNIAAPPEMAVRDARGGAMLPGLHDHHIHLAGLAARDQSVWCGPPDVMDAQALEQRLSARGEGWIRGIGYHESVLGGLPTARELDRVVPDRPLRMQHRSGRMWLLNSAALDALLAGADAPSGMERDANGYTGRLFDEDDWLRAALGSSPPNFAAASARLAAYGITGITDMTPQNGAQMARHFAEQTGSDALAQDCLLAGTLSLAELVESGWRLGPVKLHLHEAELPQFDATVALIQAAHDQGRGVALHCVSEVELVFALAVLEAAGCRTGDRIEHASVTPMIQLRQMAEMGLAVCTQPHFVAERGDRYLVDVDPHLQGDLYRLKSLSDAGIALAAGSDAPFGSADPWAAMRAAVSRQTAAGQVIGPDEALTPEAALSLYLADPTDLGKTRVIEEGCKADLCLLDRPWSDARNRLSADDVVTVWNSGRVIHDRIDQPPRKSVPG